MLSSSTIIADGSPLYKELATRSISSTIGESFLYAFIFSVGTLGNVAMLLVLYKNHRLRNITAYFVISLAISDIIMLDICAPFSIGVLIVGDWIFGYLLCQIQGFLVTWVACASLGTLALLAINRQKESQRFHLTQRKNLDKAHLSLEWNSFNCRKTNKMCPYRYFHIVKTSMYRVIFTSAKAKLIVLGGWIAALSSPLTYTAAGKDYVFQPGKFFCYFESKFSLLTLPSYIFVGISLVILIVCYLRVFKALKIHERTVAKNLRNGNTRKVSLSIEDIKVTKILFATVVGFIFCWIPISVLNVVDHFLGSGWDLTRETYYMYSIFGISSSAINPIIYGVMNPSYRKAYLRLFGIHRVGRVAGELPKNIHDHPRTKAVETHLRELNNLSIN
ncbi:melatonin receptor type 1A-like [Montipora capricornis]|uniref:melatonin receptor type 1A-like n=1 Tax=Montipora capricornis TaxID=246305 RepID=UPI0035F11DF8